MWNRLRGLFLACKKEKGGALEASFQEDQAKVLIAQGNELEERSFHDALMLYRQAIALAPEYAQGYLHLGGVLAVTGDREGAREAYSKFLQLDPNNPFAYYNLSRISYEDQDYEEVERLLTIALGIRADFPEAYVILANTLEYLGRENEALNALTVSLDLKPDFQGARYNKALLLLKMRRHEDAEEEIRQYLSNDPEYLPAVQVLAITLWGQGLFVEALDVYRFLREKDPFCLDLMSRQAFLLNYNFSINCQELYEYHRDFGCELEKRYPPSFASFQDKSTIGRKLKIGYISGDFSLHPVALFMLPVVERHNRKSFEVFCYYTSDKVDQITLELRSLADYWADVDALSHQELAERIHADAIDILVDLIGHTAGSRLPVFALQPAPVQVTWMGYLNTTGLSRMNYRICDERTDPIFISDIAHTEKLIRLPNSQWCYRPFITLPAEGVTPFERNGFITFGCFNHAIKISSGLCALWRDILLNIPNSKLLCVGLSSTRKMAELISELTMSGIAGERLQFVARTSLDQYYAWFAEADIALDTYPYGGGTTTFDTLWMGVPVVAAKGSTSASRSAASILEALGLNEWVAPSIDDYVRVAVERANDLDRIKELRKSLRRMLQTSPLMDEERFVRDLESAYRQMWQEYCEETGPFARAPA